jgi:hypothetical protein
MAARFAQGQGAYFIGSGVSAGSGLPTWSKLLEPLAVSALDIELVETDDLPAMAQYVVNANNGNRRPLLDRLYDLYERGVRPNSYHHWISLTSGLRTVWTTNYDDLLEQSFLGRPLLVRHDDESLQRIARAGTLEIVKLHGCAERSKQSDLVLTSQDYEDFEWRRPGLASRLRHALMTTNLLFVGYSYRDPNIHTALVQARRLMGENPPQHFMLLSRPDADESRFRSWADDLRRVGIEVVVVDDYSAVEATLRRVSERSRGDTIYVTGSHLMTGVDPDFPAALGRLLADVPRVVLLDGQSDGVGRSVVEAYGRACVERQQDLTNRLRLYLNPYSLNPAFASSAELVPELKGLRSALLADARVVIALPGGMGTAAEIEEARRLGCFIVPVPMADERYVGLLNQEAPRLPAWYVESARSGEQTSDDVARCVTEILA